MKENLTTKKTLIIVCVLIATAIAVVCIVAITNSHVSKKDINTQIETILNSNTPEKNTADAGTLIAEIIYQNMSYEVLSVMDGKCIVSVTAPDMNALFFDVFNPDDYGTATSMEEYNANVDYVLEQISTKLSNGDFKNITKEVELPLNDNGEIEVTYEFVNAIYGGLLTVQEELLNNYMEDDSSAQ